MMIEYLENPIGTKCRRGSFALIMYVRGVVLAVVLLLAVAAVDAKKAKAKKVGRSTRLRPVVITMSAADEAGGSTQPGRRGRLRV